jgi:hypothetical protein
MPSVLANPISLLLYMCIAYKLHSNKSSGLRYLSNTNCATENICRVVGLTIRTGLRSVIICSLFLAFYSDYFHQSLSFLSCSRSSSRQLDCPHPTTNPVIVNLSTSSFSVGWLAFYLSSSTV